jgi:putative ABC transport system permease protein
MIQDLRYGMRVLLKHKGFAAVAVLCLAVGIGANTAIFSVVNAVLLRSLPFSEADRLVMLWETHPDIPRVGPSYPDYEDWRAQAQSFEEMAVHADRYRNVMLTGGSEPIQVQGTMVSRNLFSLLGLKPVLGRTFLQEEDQPSNSQVVILSYALWQGSFAGDRGVIGGSIQLNDATFTVIGVLGDQYPLEMDVWLPLSRLNSDSLTNRMNHPITSVIGRLKPGVTIEQANREMQTIAERLQQLYPASNKSSGVVLLPMRHQLVGNLRPVVLLVFAAVALILLIACANVSNLLLAESAGRRRELAMRAALGAGRGRLMRQLLTESLLLALLGGGAGLALSIAIVPVLRSSLLGIVTAKIPGLETIGIDWRVLVFTFLATLLAGVLFGVLPALQVSRVNLNQALKEGGKSSAGIGRRKLSGMLVMSEVALAVIVMIGAGLLFRSFQKLLHVDPGFRTDRLLSLKIDLPLPQYQQDEQVRSFYQQLMPRLQALPGLQQAALTDRLPFASSKNFARFVPEGQVVEPGKERIAQLRTVDHRFFEMLGIPLRSGRLFEEKDTVANPLHQVIVNETMARRFPPDQNPIGKHLQMDWGWTLQIIGVVADITDLGLDAPAEPEIYFPGVGREAVLLVRTTVDPSSLAAAVRQTVLSIDPLQPAHQARAVEEILSTSLARRRFTVNLLGLMSLLAVSLACVGIYGVVAYSVTHQTQEIGIRLALGAQASDVLKLIIGREIAPALTGIAFGLAGASALFRLLTSLTADFLFEVRPTDPVTFAAIALWLIVVALLACYLPARKATRVDPMLALRHE